MCHTLESTPPVEETPDAQVEQGHAELTTDDGATYRAFWARPLTESGGGPPVGVVVLPDVRGLYPFYESLALRFAELGYSAVAIDYYGRTAGTDARDDDFPAMEHAMQATAEGIQADVGAAVARLRSPEGGSCVQVFTVGFCMGGQHSWLAAAGGHGLAGVVGFYGSPVRGPDGSPGPVACIDRLAGPVLALQAGDDQIVPREDSERFERELEAAGIEHELVVYDGASHAFFDRRHDEFSEESEDAWRRTLAFLERHSIGGAA